MAATTLASQAVCARATVRPQASLRATPAPFRVATTEQKFAAVRRSVKAQRKSCSALQATSSMEVAQLALDTGLIFGAATTICGMTLIGLAFGFVLLRVESLAEEGKI